MLIHCTPGGVTRSGVGNNIWSSVVTRTGWWVLSVIIIRCGQVRNTADRWSDTHQGDNKGGVLGPVCEVVLPSSAPTG